MFEGFGVAGGVRRIALQHRRAGVARQQPPRLYEGFKWDAFEVSGRLLKMGRRHAFAAIGGRAFRRL